MIKLKKLSLIIDLKKLNSFGERFDKQYGWGRLVSWLAFILACYSTMYHFFNDTIVSYGDAESHLNIAKRVVDGLTPGFAQLGGIWLPIPHLMMVPFVAFDSLWKTGLAGSIVAGFSYVVSSLYIFKLLKVLTKSKLASMFGAIVFMTNPNILYLAATPMTELPLIMFFTLSTYYFILFILDDRRLLSLITAGLFGFLATLSRYDGWFLVFLEASALVLYYAPKIKKDWRTYWPELQGKAITYGTLAFFGILIWIVWDSLILGDPFYFTNSQFSAKTQQESWYQRGELPSYHSLSMSVLYYIVTAMANTGVLLLIFAFAGLFTYLRSKNQPHRFVISLIMSIPFIFYIVTLWLGQSVIFVPHITPREFEWTLFNVRYGVMTLPFAAFFAGYLFHLTKAAGRGVLVLMMVFQMALFVVGYSPVISLADGVYGLSHAKRPDAERWLKQNYDTGVVFMDDYARTISIVRSNIPMNNTIYVGNHPYWEDSFIAPERYATWIVMQKGDTIWTTIYENPQMRARLFKYFQKTYTSPDIFIFKRIKPITERPQDIMRRFHPIDTPIKRESL